MRHWAGLVIGAIGGILVILSIAEPGLTRPVGVLLLLGGFSVAQFKAWRDMRDERDAAMAERDNIASDWEAERAARPIIKLVRPHVDVEHVSEVFNRQSTRPAGATGPAGAMGPAGAQPLQCARVQVSNASTSAQESATAQGVRARIRFDPLGTEVDGKWTAQREPILRGLGVEDLVALGAIDIAPGQSRDLDVAVKYDFESECYAFSNDSYGGDFRVPRYRLPGSEWQVTVEMTGTRVGVVRQTFSLRVGPHGLEFEDIHP